MSRNSIVNKNVSVSRDREIRTVKSLKKQEEEACTNFVLLC